MAVIDGPDVAAYLQLPNYADDRAAYIADLVNDLIDEKWLAPVDPAPASVRLMALNVAANAYYANPGQGRLESVTRSVDDASRTERYASAGGVGGGVLSLSDADLAVLNGGVRRRVGSIRVHVPGF